jgi:quercetin dioxygenase-like cupin family protein
MNSPSISIGCVSNMYTRMMVFAKAGDIEVGHSHQFDHMTLLASGRVRITTGDAEKVFSAPNIVYIKKDVVHQLEALEPNTVVFCIHALRDGGRVEDIIHPEMVVSEADKTRMIEAITN